MKKKNFEKKLTLKKATVTNLENNEMQEVVAGGGGPPESDVVIVICIPN